MYGGMGPVPMGPVLMPMGPVLMPMGPVLMPMGPVPMPAMPGAMMGPMGMGFGPHAPVPMPIPLGGGARGGNGGGVIGGVISGTIGSGSNKTAAVAAATAVTRKKTAAGQKTRHEMRERMRYIMYEIDESNDRFISGRSEPFQFLEVCCCPGGFSAYSLTAGPAPRKGIGFSLPPELGGHLPAIPQETDNFLLHFVDVTTVAANIRIGDMGVGMPGCPSQALKLDAAPDAPPVGSCQLVILDGSFLGGKDWIHKETSFPDSENPAFNVYGTEAAAHKAFIIAQLIVMANNLAPGGTLVLRLNMFADFFTAGVLGLLRHVFHGDICSYKPRSCHVHRGSYYLVCKGFDPQRAYCMQWVPRWNACLAALRARGSAPRFVPFPGVHLDNQSALEFVWTRTLYVYHVHLWRFSKLVEVAMEEKAILDQRLPNRPRQGRYTHSCGRIFAGKQCGPGTCRAAHSFEELHPFVQKAFREPRGFLYMPGSLALMQAPLSNIDPLPETLLELKQHAHMQTILDAQAAATRQQDALAAAAHAASGNVFGHVGSYDNAVELGIGGEWVQGMVHEQHGNAPPQPAAPTAPLPQPSPTHSDTFGLRLLLGDVDDGNVVMEGGFDDHDDEIDGGPIGWRQWPPIKQPEPSLRPQPGVPPLASPLGSVADYAAVSVISDAAMAAVLDTDSEFLAASETIGGHVTNPPVSTLNVRPELLRMSGYQPRLVTIEIEDDASLKALLDYLGA